MGPTGYPISFMPTDAISTANQTSQYIEAQGGTSFLFPLPTVEEGQLLEYVVYVKAIGTGDVAIDSGSFESFTLAGYTLHTDYPAGLMASITNGTTAAFTFAQMGDSTNVIVMRTNLLVVSMS